MSRLHRNRADDNLTGSHVMNLPAKKYPLTVLRLFRHIAYNTSTSIVLLVNIHYSVLSIKVSKVNVDLYSV